MIDGQHPDFLELLEKRRLKREERSARQVLKLMAAESPRDMAADEGSASTGDLDQDPLPAPSAEGSEDTSWGALATRPVFACVERVSDLGPLILAVHLDPDCQRLDDELHSPDLDRLRAVTRYPDRLSEILRGTWSPPVGAKSVIRLTPLPEEDWFAGEDGDRHRCPRCPDCWGNQSPRTTSSS